jgi:hypothetical protein
MSKKKRKKKNRHEGDGAEAPVAVHEPAAGISAASLSTFSRDLAAFGSRAEKRRERAGPVKPRKASGKGPPGGGPFPVRA